MTKNLLLYFALLLWFVVPLQAQPTILATEQAVDPDAMVEVKIWTRDINSLLGIQFALDWDDSVLDFVSAQSDVLPLFGSANYTISDSGRLRIRWNGDATPISDNYNLFTLQFKAVGMVGDTTSLVFTDDPDPNSTPFIIEVIDGSSSLLDVSLEHGFIRINGPMTSTETSTPQVVIQTCTPNPFSTEAYIPIELTRPEQLTLSVFDTHGNAVFTRTAKYTVGKQYMTLTNTDLPASGLYFYTIRGVQQSIFSDKLFFIK